MFEYFFEGMYPAAVSTDESVVRSAVEHGANVFALGVVGDTCVVCTHKVVEVIDAWRNLCSDLSLYFSVFNDVQGASRS